MSATPLITVDPSTIAQVGDNLAQMKKILDGRQTVIDMGVMTKEQVDEMQVVYESTKKLYDLYKPK